MKELIKKLNNFRLSASLISIGAVVEIIVAVLYLALYQTNGITTDVDGAESITTALYATDVKAFGMVYFIAAFVLIIVGVTLIYKAVPFIFPKSKETPIRSLGWLFLAESVLLLLMTIISIAFISKEVSRHTVGYVLLIVVALLANIYSGLWIYPTLRCRFYCPEVVKKDEVKQNKEDKKTETV